MSGPNSYTIDLVQVAAATGSLKFSLNHELAGADSGKLVLHVCDVQLALGDASYSGGGTQHDYTWRDAGLDWSAATTVSLALSDALAVASLSGLELADDEGGAVALNETFDPDGTAYTASVADAVGQVTVTPATRDPDATVDYLDGNGIALADADGVTDGFQVNLEVGDNVIGVRVRARDGTTTRTYTVTVTRGSMDASLSGLALADAGGGAVTLNEPFNPADIVYTASVANAVGQVTVTPAPSDANATVDYRDGDGNPLADADGAAAGQQVDLEVGDNVIGVRVRAQDGATTQTYTVTVWRAAPHGASSNAFLGTLALARSSGVGLPMSPGFRVFETAYTASVYTASVADPSPWVTVTPDPDHEDATVDYLDGDGNALADARAESRTASR